MELGAPSPLPQAGSGAPAGGRPRWALRHSPAIRCALVGLLAMAAYGACLDAGTVWDDEAAIAANPEIRSLRRPLRFFTDPTSAGPANWASRHLYRPLRTALYAVQWKLFPGSAWGFHLASLLLHLAGAAALGWLGALLFGRGGWTAATLWVVHPALSESVLYLAAQGNLLCVLFAVLAMAAHLQWLRGGGRLPRFGSVAAAAASMLSYEAGVVLPVLLLLLEAVLRRTGEAPGGTAFRRHLPFWLLTGAYLALRQAIVEPFPAEPWWGGSRAAAFGLQLRLWLEGWRLTLAPVGQLPRYYGHNLPAWATVEVAVTFHLATAGLVLLWWRRRLPFWVGPAVVWWYVAQAATANLLWPNAGYPFAPRFLVLALALPVMGVAREAAQVLERRPLLGVVGLAVLVAGVILDRQQAGVYRDGRALFSHILARDPGDAVARFNLAVLLYRQGRLRAAAEECETLRQTGPFRGQAAAMQGGILARAGRREAARRAYLEALQMGPDQALPRLRLAELALDEGNVVDARRWLAPLAGGSGLVPDVAIGSALAGARLASLEGDCAAARRQVNEALSRKAARPQALFAGGTLLTTCGDVEGGRTWRRRAAEAVAAESRAYLGGVVW